MYPQMIETEIFEQVQNRRKEQRKKLGRLMQPNSMNNQSPFSGRLWCGECGEVFRKYIENSGKPSEKSKWKCKHYIYKNIVHCICGVITDEQIKEIFILANWKLAGKIDLILTKSVSRFARNTVDSLQTIRKLKEKNIGIIFEKEGVNTLEATGELLITILSSQAQEESRNLSENTRWGIARRYENGVVLVNHKKFLGYTKDEDGELVIVPEQAKLVRRIYRLYLEGLSTQQIANTFMAEGIKTVTGKDKWHDTVIAKILQNEKYMGDVLQQKTYTVDFLTKKRVKTIMSKGWMEWILALVG